MYQTTLGAQTSMLEAAASLGIATEPSSSFPGHRSGALVLDISQVAVLPGGFVIRKGHYVELRPNEWTEIENSSPHIGRMTGQRMNERTGTFLRFAIKR